MSPPPPSFPSELDLEASAILNGPTVNIDAGGNLDFIGTSSSDVQITGGMVNNSGTATWLGGGAGLYLGSPATDSRACAIYSGRRRAVRHNRILKEIYLRLRANGKKPKVVMTAVMRKLIILMNRLLKNPNFQLAT